jgi:hypothetical protein
MKRYISYLILGIVFLGCSDKEVAPPENLIPEDKMKDILYDLNLLQSINSTNFQVMKNNNVNPEIYIYKKYSIDSLQFAQSNKYYLNNVEKYEKMLDEIAERITQEKQKLAPKTQETTAQDSLKKN